MPATATALRASGAARLYAQGSTLYGCLGSRRTKLGSLHGTVPFPARRVVLYALAGRYAAIDIVNMGVDTLASTVSLHDLASGSTTASAPATTPQRAAESFVTVTTLRVDAGGVAAWIGRRSSIGALTAVYEVHALSKASGDRLLASSKLEPTALATEGDTITWRTGPHRSSTTI